MKRMSMWVRATTGLWLVVAMVAWMLVGCAGMGQVNLPFSTGQVNNRNTGMNAASAEKFENLSPTRNLMNNGNELWSGSTGNWSTESQADKVTDLTGQTGLGNQQGKVASQAQSQGQASTTGNTLHQIPYYQLNVPATGGATVAAAVPGTGSNGNGIDTATLAPAVLADFTTYWKGLKGADAQVPTMISNADWAAYLVAKQATPVGQ